MSSLIFSADDFGKSKIANSNILKLVSLGKVQRVAVIVDGIYSKAEIKELLDSKIKLDAHLTLPNTNYHREQKKILKRTFKFLSMLLAGKTTMLKVEQSWEKQIKKFYKVFGRYPDGLNSHEHVHFFPPYFKIALKLREQYKIPHVRAASKKIINNGNKIGRIIKVLNGINKQKRVGYPYLTSLDWIDNFEKFASNLPDGTTELVCHPEREEEFKKIILPGFAVFPAEIG